MKAIAPFFSCSSEAKTKFLILRLHHFFARPQSIKQRRGREEKDKNNHWKLRPNYEMRDANECIKCKLKLLRSHAQLNRCKFFVLRALQCPMRHFHLCFTTNLRCDRIRQWMMTLKLLSRAIKKTLSFIWIRLIKEFILFTLQRVRIPSFDMTLSTFEFLVLAKTFSFRKKTNFHFAI